MTGTVPDMAPSGRAARDTSSQYSCGVICARGLEKRFGERRVLRGVEFDVPRARAPRPRRTVQLARRRRRRSTRSRTGGTAGQRVVRGRDARSGPRPPVRNLAPRSRMTYLSDVAALARKDLTLELRARDTLPAMLLFVLSTLVIFHFVLPADSSELAAKGL